MQLAAGAYALIGGVVSFLGWLLDIRRLADWDNTGICILPNAALCAALSGLALVMLALDGRRGALICGAVVGLIGGATAVEWIGGVSFGIDSLLLFDRTWGNVAVAYPGRMGPPATASWTMIGVALVLAALPRTIARGRFIATLGLMALAIGMISTVGRLYDASLLFTVPRLTVIASQTATFVVAVAVGLVACVPDRQPLLGLLADSSAGMLARRMLPVLIALPIVLGYLRVIAVDASLFDSDFGTTLAVLIEILLLSLLLWSMLRLIARYEQARRTSADRTDAILGSITDAFFSMDHDWRITFVNDATEKRWDRPREQVIGNRLWEMFPAAVGNEAYVQLLRAMTGRTAVEYDVFYEPSRRWFHEKAYPTADGGLAVYSQDTTERRRAAQTHAVLAAIVQSSDDAIISKDLSGIITSWNRGAERLFGYTAAEVIGQPGLVLIPPDHVDEEPAILARVRRGEPVEPYETVRRRKDGTRVDVSLSVSPITNADGVVVGASKIARDISDRKRHQQEVLQLSEQLQLVTDTAPALISYVDSEVRYRFVNKGYENWFGCRREAILGREMREVLGQAAYDLVKPHIDTALAGRREAFDAEVPYKDGGTRFVHAEYVPDVRTDGSVAGFYALVTDISENKQAEQALRAAKDSLETANQAKDNFLATLSHELRTPLTPVLATLGAWETSPQFPAALQDDLLMIRRNVDLEARLIDDLLDLTRITRGKLSLNLEVIDVQTLLTSVASMYRSEISAKQLALTLDAHAEQRFVRADPGRLQQVFWNLLKNAIKFTPKGGSIEITLRNAEPGQVEIRFRDSGIGISPEMLGRLFTPFEQEDADAGRRYGGLGLGLAITKKLLEAQDGQISAYSEGKDRGATFVITLRYVDPPAEQSDSVPARVENNGRPARETRLRVLLVEDHMDTARVLSRLMQMNGHEVVMVHCVADALKELAGGAFDVMVSDIGLPDGTGIELIRQVREQCNLTLPAIALTGFGMDEDIARCHDAGFTQHLTKPVNFAKLEEAIQGARGKVGRR